MPPKVFPNSLSSRPRFLAQLGFVLFILRLSFENAKTLLLVSKTPFHFVPLLVDRIAGILGKTHTFVDRILIATWKFREDQNTKESEENASYGIHGNIHHDNAQEPKHRTQVLYSTWHCIKIRTGMRVQCLTSSQCWTRRPEQRTIGITLPLPWYRGVETALPQGRYLRQWTRTIRLHYKRIQLEWTRRWKTH